MTFKPCRVQQRRLIGQTAVLLVIGISILASMATGAKPAKPPKPAGAFQIAAWEFDRGNAKVFANPDIYADYRDKFPQLVVGDGGQSPWAIEYDIDFPVDTTYTLKVCYGSPAQRPLEVWLDGKSVGKCCGRVTGNPPPYMDRHPQHDLPRDAKNFHGIEWEEACKLKVAKGKHTLKFSCEGLPPRLNALRLESPVAFPKEWKMARRKPKLENFVPMYRRIFMKPDDVNTGSLRLAIEDHIKAFGPGYPKGAEYLKRLDVLEKKQLALASAKTNELKQVQGELKSLQQQAMLDHPALDFDKLLLVTKKDRGASTYTGHLQHANPGGNLCVLSPVSPNGKLTPLVPELTNGVFGRFELSFAADKVVFCYCNSGENYRIYEIDIDPKTGRRVPGSKLRHLTCTGVREADTVERFKGSNCGGGYDDIDPCYLPNGKIIFASTRSERSVLCFPATVTTLFVMDPDGKNARCLSKGQVNEISPAVLDDGRVVYMRWEYVDKGFGNVQSLWAIRPDGSGSDHVYKNSLVRPGSMMHARSVPNSQRFVATAAGHHGGHIGPIVLVDNRRNRRNAQGMLNLTPEASYPGMGSMTSKGGLFRDPHPFSEKFFLVSHNPRTGHKFEVAHAIYTLDAWGNRAEIYRNPTLACLQPMPLRPRRKPVDITPVIGSETAGAQTDKAKEQQLATVFLQDVYKGLKGVERGRVKYIRVMDALNLSWSDTYRAGKNGDGAGMQASAVSLGGDVAVKKVHGIATVREDGSAYFTVPANENIFFQALDENYMELQRMRTFLNLMPGENRACVGCHEVRRQAPKLKQTFPQALDHPVEALYPQPGDTGPRMVHYARDIQPIWDNNCLGCHSGEKPKGDLDLTGKLTGLWSTSYENLTKKELVMYLHTCGYGSSCVPVEPPMTFGSHRSPLVKRLQKDPCKTKVTREEFIRIVTWIDANAPFYGTHQGRKNLKWKDEPDFRPMPLAMTR